MYKLVPAVLQRFEVSLLDLFFLLDFHLHIFPRASRPSATPSAHTLTLAFWPPTLNYFPFPSQTFADAPFPFVTTTDQARRSAKGMGIAQCLVREAEWLQHQAYVARQGQKARCSSLNHFFRKRKLRELYTYIVFCQVSEIAKMKRMMILVQRGGGRKV